MTKLYNVKLYSALVACAASFSGEKVLTAILFSLTQLSCINQFHSLFFFQLIIVIPVLSDTPHLYLLNAGVKINLTDAFKFVCRYLSRKNANVGKNFYKHMSLILRAVPE